LICIDSAIYLSISKIKEKLQEEQRA